MQKKLLLGAVVAGLFALLIPQPCYSSQCYLNFSPDKFPACAHLSPNVSLHWIAQAGAITWAVDIDGAWDWVGLGISEGGMLGADIAVAAHDANAQEWTAADYWSAGFAFPQLDKQQDVTLVSVMRQSHGNAYGSTLVAMRRPLVSCDPWGQDRSVLGDTRQTFVFAYGTGPFGYHGTSNRGDYDLVFLPNTTAASATPAATVAPTLQVLDLKMPNFTIPTSMTTYQCVNMELPSDSKYHIYAYEPLIDNAPLVHHFVAYTCRDDAPPATAVGVPYDCLQYMECEDFFIGWAPGMGRVDAAPAAALAFGAGTGIKYLSLQIHYTNMDGVAGQTDSSGFRISYSPTLKTYDMGVLTLGTHDINVPAGSPSWSTVPSLCPGACTAQMMAGAGPGAAMTLVDSFYHMHQQGRSMVTRHVRNGVELPPLGTRDFFSFDYQFPVAIPPDSRQLLPGDDLITSCTYSGVGRSTNTTFGLASYEEMCFNFLTYYPYNASVTNCVAMPDGFATCSTNEGLSAITREDAAAVQAGLLVPLPTNVTFSPYAPTCVRSVAASTPASTPGDGSSQDSQHHRRNVGGAVAAILIVTLVGVAGIVVAYRAMRKKRQVEEEQHLFEKYNPNSTTLPVAGTVAGGGVGAAFIATPGKSYNNGYHGSSGTGV